MYPSRKTRAKLEIIAVMISVVGMTLVITLWGDLVTETLTTNFDFWAAATFFVHGLFIVVPFGFMIFVLQTALRVFLSGLWTLFLDSVSLVAWGLGNWLFSWFMWQLVANVPAIEPTVVGLLQATFALVTLLPIVLLRRKRSLIFHDISIFRNKPSILSDIVH